MLNNCKTHGVCKRHISAILQGEYTLTAFLQDVRDKLGVPEDTTIFHIGIVGSHAYGDEQPDSDYDLMVLTLMPLSAYLSPVSRRLSSNKRSVTWWFGKTQIQATAMDFYHFTSQVASRGYAHMETVFGEPLYTLNNSWQARFIEEIHGEIRVHSADAWIAHMCRMMLTYRSSAFGTGDMSHEKLERVARRCLKFIQWMRAGKLPSREMLLSNEELSPTSLMILNAFLNPQIFYPIPKEELNAQRTGEPLALNQAFLDILQWHSGKRLGPSPALTTYALAAELAAPYEKNIGTMPYLKPIGADHDGHIE